MNRVAWLAVALVATTGTSWAAFDRPSSNDRARALGNLYEETGILRRLLTPDDDFAPIPLPGANDWLTLHEEPGQTFEVYRESGANRPDAVRHVIYLLPIGDFPADSRPPLAEVRDYAAIYFQMEVRLLPAFQPDPKQFEPRQNPRFGRRHVLTSSVRDFLQTRLPVDAYCLLGVTMADLYPAPSWNYVFGEASLSDRVGIHSFVRYDPKFWGDKRPPDYREIILQRTCKVLAHEIGHMFGLQHCIYYSCVMDGCNHMVEADASPQHLCPVCLRKLHYCIGFDALKRHEELARFYKRHGWSDECDWVNRQLAKASKG
jgi:archaemetzincin